MIASESVGSFGARRHCRGSSFPPDHWVVLVGGLLLSGHDGSIVFRLWSWGGEYLVDGAASAFTEYLYAIVTGT